MKSKDIVLKKDNVLRKDLTDLRKSLEKARFEISTKEEKDMKKIKNIKRDIARILTIFREREIEALEANQKNSNN